MATSSRPKRRVSQRRQAAVEDMEVDELPGEVEVEQLPAVSTLPVF
jgi:hypothetical protein